MKMRYAIAVTLLFAVCVAARAQSGDERSVITIALANEAILDDTVIYLDQIAKLSGGSAALRQRLARIDIAEFKLGVERTSVTSTQVKYRLLLAGYSEGQIRITGSQTKVLATDEPVTARKILTAADDFVRGRHPHAAVAGDVIVPQLEVRAVDRVDLEAKWSTAAPRNGRSRVDVVIKVNGQLRDIVAVPFELDARPASAKTPLESASRPTPQQPIEKILPLIKARDRVKIVVALGAAQVTASGEAQQDGKLGDIINVRNTDSNTIIRARVEAAGVVVVEY